MANTSKKSKAVIKEEDKVIEAEVVLDEPKEAETPKEKAKIEIVDRKDIPCRSVVAHKVYYDPTNSLFSYEWDGFETIKIPYGHILEIIKKAKGIFMKPYIVIDDNEFVEEMPKLKALYEDYSCVNRLETLITKDNNTIRKELALVPASMRGVLFKKVQYLIASGKINNISLIRLLERDFGCSFMDIIEEE